jgi:hypothetical protein
VTSTRQDAAILPQTVHPEARSLPGPATPAPMPSYATAAAHGAPNTFLYQDVAILDVRGRVETIGVGPGEEKSSYLSGYDDYLEGHIPVRESGCVCISVHLSAYNRAHAHVCVCACVCLHVHVCVDVPMHCTGTCRYHNRFCSYACMHACMRACMRACVHV